MKYKIKKTDFLSLLNQLSKKSKCYVPYEKNNKFFLDLFDFDKVNSIVLDQVRSSQPLKSFLTHPRKELMDLENTDQNIIIVGAKACDLASLKIQDFVFSNGDIKDPFYVKNRQRLTIISSDCNPARETCFCMAIEGKPYPENGFDINVSFAGDFYLLEVGSDKGQTLLEDYKSYLAPASPKDLEIQDRVRLETTGQVESFIQSRGTPKGKELAGKVMQNYTSQIWKDFYSTCVECGACNLICATCHCFLLFDKHEADRPKRFMEWDACLYRRFARVAGGANPRKHLWERLRNRFEKKFEFFPKVMGINACTGCGRCIEGCPGKIDIREVLKGLVNGKWNLPPNE